MQTYLVDERANWKVGLDAQNELYHLPFQHRRILGDAFLMNDKGHCRFQDVNLYNYHSVWSCEYDPTHKLTPLESIVFAAENGAPVTRIPQMIGEFDFFVLFPNFVILLFDVGNSTSYVSYNFWPLAIDRTIWEIRMHFRSPRTRASASSRNISSASSATRCMRTRSRTRTSMRASRRARSRT